MVDSIEWDYYAGATCLDLWISWLCLPAIRWCHRSPAMIVCMSAAWANVPLHDLSVQHLAVAYLSH